MSTFESPASANFIPFPLLRSDFLRGESCRGALGARLRGRTATQRSKKGSEKVLGKGRVLRRVLRRGPAVGFTVKKGSQKGF